MSPDAAASLAHDAQRGDRAARDRLILSYAPVVRYLAFRQAGSYPRQPDVGTLIQAGLVALAKAVDSYDASACSFEQHAWTQVSEALAAYR